MYYVFEHSDINNHKPKILKETESFQEACSFAFERCSILLKEDFKLTGGSLEIPSFEFNNQAHCVSVSAGFATDIKML